MIAVFVPSLMGVGLLVSVGIVVADLARRFLPGTAARRLRARHRRALALVTPLADALGRAPPELPPMSRTKRHRLTYIVVAFVAAALSVYVSVGATANYLREGGYVEGLLWLEVLSLAASTAFLMVSAVAVLVVLRYDSLPRWTSRLVRATPLGALDVRALRRAPRPRPLRTRLRGAADDAVAWFDHLLDTCRVIVAVPTPGHGVAELVSLRNHHDELAAADTSVLVVAPAGERHHLAAVLSPLIVVSDPDDRLLPHLGVEHPDGGRPQLLLVEMDGRISWRRPGQPGALWRFTPLWRAVQRRPLAVLTPSDVLGPIVAAQIAVVFVCLGLLAFVADSALLSWDRPIRDAVRDVGERPIGTILRRATDLGSRKVLAPLALPIVVLAWRQCRRFAVTFLLALPAGVVLELILKALVDRPRPPFALGFGGSFPSGHVVASVAFWGLIPPWAYLMTRRRDVWVLSAIVSLSIVVLVGASRVYVGAHWPSDVAGGALIGALFLLVAEWAIHNPAPREHAVACPLHPPRPVRERVSDQRSPIFT